MCALQMVRASALGSFGTPLRTGGTPRANTVYALPRERLRRRTIAIKERLTELGIGLPPAMVIKGQRFETVRVSGDRITIAGHLPLGDDGRLAGPFGKVGAEVGPEEAHRSARRIALGMIASLDAAGVDLDRVVWRKAFGMVNAAPDFNALPGVVDGFSDVLLEVFGERGRHTRSAIGVAELPFGAPVEIEAEAALLPADTTAAAPPATPVPKPEPVDEAAGEPRRDRGLVGVDYAGVNPLTIAAEALVRSIKALSHLFWISITGTVATVFFATLANLDGAAGGMLEFGEYDIPLSVLPTACLSFAMFLLWLTAARLKMLDAALADEDLTASVARDIFRLDPPVLDVFEAGNLRPFALLSGFSVVLWNWSLFFGSSIGLIFSAAMIRGATTSVDTTPAFFGYAAFTLAIMVYGTVRIVPLLREILERLHGERMKVGPARIALAILVVIGGVALANPDLPRLLTQEEMRTVGPGRANAIDGETLVLEQGETIVLAGIEALRPGQTCRRRDGRSYPCGDQATAHLQSLVHDVDVFCFVYYPNLGICITVPEGSPPPQSVEDTFNDRNLQGRMVAAGFAFAEGDGGEALGELQDEAQRKRVGAWQGSFQPPRRWAKTR